jgi:hypothetical protein
MWYRELAIKSRNVLPNSEWLSWARNYLRFKQHEIITHFQGVGYWYNLELINRVISGNLYPEDLIQYYSPI